MDSNSLETQWKLELHGQRGGGCRLMEFTYAGMLRGQGERSSLLFGARLPPTNVLRHFNSRVAYKIR